MNPPKIELRHASKVYRSRAGSVGGVEDISLEIHEGEFVAICGRSGSGKSTILSLLGLLERVDQGQCHLDGDDVTRLGAARAAALRGSKIGFVFQSFNLLGYFTVLQNVALPAEYRGRTSRDSAKRAMYVLEMFGLERLASRLPDELSGGQRQLAAICRGLVNDPPIILADEPTGNLDSKSARHVVDTLLRLNSEAGKTIVMVTHDQALAKQAERIVSVSDGRIT